MPHVIVELWLGKSEAAGAQKGACHGSYFHHRQHGRTRPRNRREDIIASAMIVIRC
jgi:hypothetical protein